MVAREKPIEVEDAAVSSSVGRSRALVLTVLAAPALAIVAFDIAERGRHIVQFSPRAAGAYLATVLEGGVLWGVLLFLACAPRGRLRALAFAAFVLAGPVMLGTQRYFHEQYGTYLNLDAMLFGASFGDSVWHQVRVQLPTLLRALVTPMSVALALALTARALIRPAPRGEKAASRLLLPALLAPMILPCVDRAEQAATPDVILLRALGSFAEVKLGLLHHGARLLPGERTPEYVPAMAARPSRPRNVLFILTESVRADVVCSSYDPACQGSPASNRATPARMPLLSMRANDSTTAVSVAVLFTGEPPTAQRDEMHSAPTLWELGRAAGYDTAYWTSQDLRFGNSDMFVRDVGAHHKIDGATLDPGADLDLGADDASLTAHVKASLGQLHEPFVAVVHYANTHFPYWVDAARSPFQPSELTKDPARAGDLFRHYQNAVYLQDLAVGDLLTTLRETDVGARTVVVYTSDHGESFREHGQMGHTLSIFDEEIHVPAWIDAPAGTLSLEEVRALKDQRNAPTFHTDLLPTFADLLGIWDAPELLRFRARYIGRSLLRDGNPDAVIPITNCASLWDCPFKNWGLMQGTRKLEAREWDRAWHCFDVAVDPGEQRDLGPGACGDLPARAQTTFGGLPRAWQE